MIHKCVCFYTNWKVHTQSFLASCCNLAEEKGPREFVFTRTSNPIDVSHRLNLVVGTHHVQIYGCCTATDLRYLGDRTVGSTFEVLRGTVHCNLLRIQRCRLIDDVLSARVILSKHTTPNHYLFVIVCKPLISVENRKDIFNIQNVLGYAKAYVREPATNP